MKLWRCNFYDADQGQLVSWHPSREAARRDLARMQAERPVDPSGPEGIQEEHIPTDKKGLIEWLNANLSSDNG